VKGEEDGIGYLCVKNNQGSRAYFVLPSKLSTYKTARKVMTNKTKASLAMQFAGMVLVSGQSKQAKI
jgi:hypothetical protein